MNFVEHCFWGRRLVKVVFIMSIIVLVAVPNLWLFCNKPNLRIPYRKQAWIFCYYWKCERPELLMVCCYYSSLRGKHTRLCMWMIHPPTRGDCIDRKIVAYPLVYDLRYVFGGLCLYPNLQYLRVCTLLIIINIMSCVITALHYQL